MVTERDEPRGAGERGLTAALLGAPLVFLAGFQALYLIGSTACLDGGGGALHLVPPVGAAVSLGLAAVGARAWRDSGGWPGDANDVADQRRFLAALTALGGAGFAVLLLALWIPVALLDPCWGA